MYQVIILPKALKDLLKLDKAMAKRITDKLLWLSNNFETVNITPLKSNLAGFYKLKVSDYRAIYDIDHIKSIIAIHRVGHRKEIYNL